jgi:hypothetical protein
MKGGEVAGQTDFFYGFGTLYVTNTLVTLRSCGGGITAWKGTNTTFENKYGVYITDSVVQKANSSLSIAGKCALGRPWVSNFLHDTRNYLIPDTNTSPERTNAFHLFQQLPRRQHPIHRLHRLEAKSLQQLHRASRISRLRTWIQRHGTTAGEFYCAAHTGAVQALQFRLRGVPIPE